ncbi:MAG: alpha/beta hydrolase [Eubacteriales bacterium]|nr:alpha/beta hydrolase [Eubacteriales bacterium]
MVNYAVWKRYPELNPIDLWEADKVPEYRREYGQDVPFLTPFLLPGSDNPVILIFPGGGYEAKAAHESDNIAKRMNELGFSAFVLDYRVKPYPFPVPQLDAWRAIRLVRRRAREFGIHADKIIVLGFSAGGHLAASVGIVNDDGDATSPDAVERVSSRPNAMVLCYGALNLATHVSPRSAGGTPLGIGITPGYEWVLSPVERVNAHTIPAFLWQTSDDELVAPGNSLEMYAALQKHRVPVEMHLYRHGHHGMHLALEDESVGTWSVLCAQFLHQLGF